MKIVLKFILAVIIISSFVVITPSFLNFMETQNDILCKIGRASCRERV